MPSLHLKYTDYFKQNCYSKKLKASICPYNFIFLFPRVLSLNSVFRTLNDYKVQTLLLGQ